MKFAESVWVKDSPNIRREKIETFIFIGTLN